MIALQTLNRLNAETAQNRLKNLQTELKSTEFIPVDMRMINNHIHTTYSFSPYSPTAAVYAARADGLCTAGIVDHDSIGGAKEFIEAGKLVGIPTTIGVETRVSMDGTSFAQLRTNNPDQVGVSYMVLHGIPHAHINAVQSYFAPLREHRNVRNRSMVERINALYADQGVSIAFERDVLPLSMALDGGCVTERHLMLALAKQLEQLNHANATPLENMFAEYDLVGKLKKECIPKVYIDATNECPSLADFVSFAGKVNGILAYAYLGDVTTSVTGDKNAQKFEDEHLDELFKTLDDYGVKAITYMPTRNSDAQLKRLRDLCTRYGMFQISGEDINSPRQSFIIEKMKDTQFANLIESTWDIIRHENGDKA
ncbi:MAG: PHP domain-containing protein [Clostridia bacterium]